MAVDVATTMTDEDLAKLLQAQLDEEEQQELLFQQAQQQAQRTGPARGGGGGGLGGSPSSSKKKNKKGKVLIPVNMRTTAAVEQTTSSTRIGGQEDREVDPDIAAAIAASLLTTTTTTTAAAATAKAPAVAPAFTATTTTASAPSTELAAPSSSESLSVLAAVGAVEKEFGQPTMVSVDGSNSSNSNSINSNSSHSSNNNNNNRNQTKLLSADDGVEPAEAAALAAAFLSVADRINEYYGEDLLVFARPEDKLKVRDRVVMVGLDFDGFELKVGRRGIYRRYEFTEPVATVPDLEGAFLATLDEEYDLDAFYDRSVRDERRFLNGRAVRARHTSVQVVAHSSATPAVEEEEEEDNSADEWNVPYEGSEEGEDEGESEYDHEEEELGEGEGEGEADGSGKVIKGVGEEGGRAAAQPKTPGGAGGGGGGDGGSGGGGGRNRRVRRRRDVKKERAVDRLWAAREECAALTPYNIVLNRNNSEAARLTTPRKLLRIPVPDSMATFLKAASLKLNVRRVFLHAFTEDGVEVTEVAALVPHASYVFTHEETFTRAICKLQKV